MTHDQIKEKVIGYVHGKDGKGDWILPWQHMGANCVPCDQLVEFIEGILKSEAAFKNPLAKGAPLTAPTLMYERKCREIIEKYLDTPPEASLGWKHFKLAGCVNGPTFCLNANEPGPLYVVDDETHKCK